MFKFYFGVLSLFLATASCTYIPSIGLISPRSDISLARFLLSRQNQVQATDASTSAQCFSIYLPLLQDVANQWQVDYNECVEDANADRSALMKEMSEERDAMSQDADGVCSFINNCQAENETLDFFNCFATLGENVLGTVYTISNNASDSAAELLQKLEVIDVTMYKCTNASERAYVENTAKVYDALDDCLLNGPPATAAPPSTSTTDTTTDAPTTTTTPAPTAVPKDLISDPNSPSEGSARSAINIKNVAKKAKKSLASYDWSKLRLH